MTVGGPITSTRIYAANSSHYIVEVIKLHKPLPYSRAFLLLHETILGFSSSRVKIVFVDEYKAMHIYSLKCINLMLTAHLSITEDINFGCTLYIWNNTNLLYEALTKIVYSSAIDIK